MGSMYVLTIVVRYDGFRFCFTKINEILVNRPDGKLINPTSVPCADFKPLVPQRISGWPQHSDVCFQFFVSSGVT